MIPDLEAIARQIAPTDLADGPLYFLRTSEANLPPALRVENVRGLTCVFLDVAASLHLESQGRWRGRGPLILLGDVLLRTEAARIRAAWPESEHRLRAGLPPGPEPFTFPVVDARLLDGDGRPAGDRGTGYRSRVAYSWPCPMMNACMQSSSIKMQPTFAARSFADPVNRLFVMTAQAWHP